MDTSAESRVGQCTGLHNAVRRAAQVGVMGLLLFLAATATAQESGRRLLSMRSEAPKLDLTAVPERRPTTRVPKDRAHRRRAKGIAMLVGSGMFATAAAVLLAAMAAREPAKGPFQGLENLGRGVGFFFGGGFGVAGLVLGGVGGANLRGALGELRDADSTTGGSAR